MPKKVLLIPSWFPSKDDAISGIFVQEQAIALSKQFDVVVLIPGMAAWRNVLNSNATDKSVKGTQEGLTVYREFVRPRIPHGPEFIDYHTFARAAESGFKRVVKEWGIPDVIHAHVVLPAGWAALKVARRHGIPIVLTEHSGPFGMHMDTELKRRLVGETFAGVDRVIAVSPALAEQILSVRSGLNIDVIGNSVRTDFFVPAENTEQENRTGTRFLVAGRLVESKGLDHLLNAVRILLDRGLNSFELVIGGDGPDRVRLEDLAKSLGVTERCQFLGALSREQIKERMQNCDVFVLSSLHETFGVVVGEAMACGKPVISTRCGGPEFVVNEKTGVLVDVADPQALANAMAEFMLDRVSFDPKAVRDSVLDRFSPEAFVRNVAAVYEQVW